MNTSTSAVTLQQLVASLNWPFGSATSGTEGDFPLSGPPHSALPEGHENDANFTIDGFAAETLRKLGVTMAPGGKSYGYDVWVCIFNGTAFYVCFDEDGVGAISLTPFVD